MKYFCAAEEKGLECGTHHIHIYVLFKNPVRFSTVKYLFASGGDIRTARGTSAECRAYVSKTGAKWENDKKSDTKIESSFEEYGEFPDEKLGATCIEGLIITRIQDGATNAELISEFPHFALKGLRDIEYVRQSLRAEEYRNRWRDLETVYIFGETNTGKTRSVFDKHGYSNVYAVSNYKHPFDLYFNEEVMLFDEFTSGIRIQDMNNYLDGYPIALPARYTNKQACYEKVYIISNLELRHQYRSVQNTYPAVWSAFLRRIHQVVHFLPNGIRREYSTDEYMQQLNSD